MSTTPPSSTDASEPTSGAVYELEAGTYPSGELRVLSFEGYEEINGLFAVEIIFWAKDVDELDLQSALLGRPASLGMHLAGGSARYLRGIVRALTVEGKHAAARHAFRLSLVPRLWLLGKRVVQLRVAVPFLPLRPVPPVGGHQLLLRRGRDRKSVV